MVVGGKVFLRDARGRCYVPWSGPHRITFINSNVSVELDDDNVSRHVSHLRLVPQNGKNDDDLDIEFALDVNDKPNRPTRIRKPPACHNDYIFLKVFKYYYIYMLVPYINNIVIYIFRFGSSDQ